MNLIIFLLIIVRTCNISNQTGSWSVKSFLYLGAQLKKSQAKTFLWVVLKHGPNCNPFLTGFILHQDEKSLITKRLKSCLKVNVSLLNMTFSKLVIVSSRL